MDSFYKSMGITSAEVKTSTEQKLNGYFRNWGEENAKLSKESTDKISSSSWFSLIAATPNLLRISQQDLGNIRKLDDLSTYLEDK